MLNANDYILFDKHSLIFLKGDFYLKSSYLKIDDRIDVFNFKAKELGSLERFGAIGDMEGYQFSVGVGLNNQNSLFMNYQHTTIESVNYDLVNKHIDIFNRVNLFDNFSFDLGFMIDKANSYNITDDDMLNSLINKIDTGSRISVKDGKILLGDASFTFYDENGWKIKPKVRIGDIESKSFYIRFLNSKRFLKNHSIDYYVGFKQTDIKTVIDFYPKEDIVDIPLTKSLNRDEQDINFGLTYSYNYQRYGFELNYEFHKIYRDKELDYINYNHIVNSIISRKMTDNLRVFIGGKLMTQQFNTDLPYLYTKYTQTQFDKKYGYAKIGFIYHFNKN